MRSTKDNDDGPPILQTERLVLRLLEPADAERVSEILSRPEVGRMIRAICLPYPVPAARGWLIASGAEWEEGRAARFAVLKDGVLIGCTDISGIRPIQSGCTEGELGFWFDPPAWGQGLACEAATAVLKFAVARFGVHQVTATCAADNKNSATLLHRLGFTKTDRRFVWSRSRRGPIAQIGFRLTTASIAKPVAEPGLTPGNQLSPSQ